MPGQTEAVTDGRNGRVVAQNNVDALAGVLEELASSPAEQRRLGETARRDLSAFLDEEGVEARMSAFFKKACHKL